MMTIRNQQGLRGEYREREPLARHSSWRVGGPADRWYEPADIADLCDFLAQLPEHEPVTLLGLGSNLLVRDGGIRGTVICTSELGDIEILPGHRYVLEAGVPCAKFARIAARNGSAGAEWYCGIPGTMGGALAMNAGAHGGETWPQVEQVELVDRRGRLHLLPASAFHYGYRHVELPPQQWFTRCWLQLPAGEVAVAEARIRELLAHRSRTQPTGLASCGSVFRNPAGDHAGRLIETAGCKGRQVGGASVSDRHANFIVNAAGARAADMEQLMIEVAAEVLRVHGVALEAEVRIIGEASHD